MRPARFSCSRFTTCMLSIHMDETCAICGRRTSGERQLLTGDKDTRKVNWSSRPVVKPHARIARLRPWLLQRVPCLTT